MDFDGAKRTGFLVDFAWSLASETRARHKEVPVDVYEHTLSRSDSAMPVACLHAAFVPDARRGVARLGDVLGQADRVRRVPNHPGRYARVSSAAASLRPLLPLLQPFRLD